MTVRGSRSPSNGFAPFLRGVYPHCQGRREVGPLGRSKSVPPKVSVKVRANCSGRMPPYSCASRQGGGIRTVSGATYGLSETWEAAFCRLCRRR